MSTAAAIATRNPAELATSEAPLPAETVARIRAALESAASESTRRAYRSDWACYTRWTECAGRCALPASPETVAAYVVWLESEGKAVSTIRRRVATVSKAHRSQASETPNPCRSELVRTVLRGTARQRSEGHGKGASPVLPDHVRLMLASTPEDDLRSQRDRAIALFLMATGMRRSEVAALTVADVDGTDPRGLVVTIRRSKTDQTGEGREVTVTRSQNPRTCPVRAVLSWLRAAGISEGPVFRGVNRHGTVQPRPMTGKGISHAVKAMADRAGLDSARISPHGFRAGHVSARRAAGEDAAAVMDTTGHRSIAMVRRYDRAARRFRSNATASLGL